MSTVRHTLDLDADTNERLQSLAVRRGQDAAEVVADAISLLAATVDIDEPDIAEDQRRLREFERTGEAVPGDEVKAWVESWGTDNELPRPRPRKLR